MILSWVAISQVTHLMRKFIHFCSRNPPKDADPGTYNDRSHPSVMTCFRSNISPDVMKFIGVLQMVKGVGLSGMTAEELLHIALAVYLLK